MRAAVAATGYDAPKALCARARRVFHRAVEEFELDPVPESQLALAAAMRAVSTARGLTPQSRLDVRIAAARMLNDAVAAMTLLLTKRRGPAHHEEL